MKTFRPSWVINVFEKKISFGFLIFFYYLGIVCKFKQHVGILCWNMYNVLCQHLIFSFLFCIYWISIAFVFQRQRNTLVFDLYRFKADMSFYWKCNNVKDSRNITLTDIHQTNISKSLFYIICLKKPKKIWFLLKSMISK